MIKACLNEGDALYFPTAFPSSTRTRPASCRRPTWTSSWWRPRGRAHGAHQFSGRQRHQLQLCRIPGPHRPGRERTLALGIAIGSGYLFPTTFEKEVHSDLTGERGVLMGCLAGVMEAQYNLLRKHGHSPSEAFNETVEELTQSLIRLVAENGMDWMFGNCSTTAQRGALDWAPRSGMRWFRCSTISTKGHLRRGNPAGLEANSTPDYREKLQAELDASKNSRCGAPAPPSGRCARKTGGRKK
jgi:ketol-acid reductoisomerase